MNDVKKELGVKNMSDLVSKEIKGAYGKKLTKEEIKCVKMTKKEIFEKFGKSSKDELDIISNNIFLLKI